MTFREKLIGTIRCLQVVLEEPGVLIIGSEVPNLLQPNAASTLVVSQDVDLAVPVDRVKSVRMRLNMVKGLIRSADEPSVYVPTVPGLLEANFLGLDSRLRDASETYVLEDPDLPLMVFGPLGLLRPGPVVEVEGLRLPLPKASGLMAEKLLTDRTDEKGARDLLVVAGMLVGITSADLDELVQIAIGLSAESRHTICSGLSVLSLMEGRAGMPNPALVRQTVRHLLSRIGGPL